MPDWSIILISIVIFLITVYAFLRMLDNFEMTDKYKPLFALLIFVVLLVLSLRFWRPLALIIIFAVWCLGFGPVIVNWIKKRRQKD